MPALRRARDLSKRTQCANQLKQYAIATTEYLNDHNEWFPCSIWNNNYSASMFGFTSTNTDGLWTYTLADYTEKIFRCPVTGVDDPDVEQNYNSLGIGGYGWNTRAFGYEPNYVTSDNYGSPRKATTVSKPSRSMVVSDRRFYTYLYCILASNSDSRFAPSSRHNGGSNLFCADGHVTWEKLSDIYSWSLSSPKAYYWDWYRK
jgi:prepilin-type processing-associated H-X9-DG protein